jgi:hypothetical protein
MKYQLGSTELTLRVLSVDDARIDITRSFPMRAVQLKRWLNCFDQPVLYVTSTTPLVFFMLQSSLETYNMSYRAFLGFVSQLSLYEEPVVSLEWKKLGF